MEQEQKRKDDFYDVCYDMCCDLGKTHSLLNLLYDMGFDDREMKPENLSLIGMRGEEIGDLIMTCTDYLYKWYKYLENNELAKVAEEYYRNGKGATIIDMESPTALPEFYKAEVRRMVSDTNDLKYLECAYYFVRNLFRKDKAKGETA